MQKALLVFAFLFPLALLGQSLPFMTTDTNVLKRIKSFHVMSEVMATKCSNLMTPDDVIIFLKTFEYQVRREHQSFYSDVRDSLYHNPYSLFESAFLSAMLMAYSCDDKPRLKTLMDKWFKHTLALNRCADFLVDVAVDAAAQEAATSRP